MLSSQVTVPFHVPTSTERAFLLLHTRTSTRVASVLGFALSHSYVVTSLCFNLRLPSDIRCGASLRVLICYLHIFLVRCLLRSLIHF